MLLKAENISFRYGKGPWILQGIEMELESGEVVGLSGPSGCGKTTLAQILAGYRIPVAGKVTIDGNPFSAKGYNPVQLIFQHPEKSVNPRWQMHKTLFEGWSPEDELLCSLGIEKAG